MLSFSVQKKKKKNTVYPPLPVNIRFDGLMVSVGKTDLIILAKHQFQCRP